jgi:plasmid stabilization system protein ParE
VDYRVFFTKKALAELAEIADYIAADSPDAATRFGNALLDHVSLLERFPRMGPVADERSQVRVLVHGPILVYYRIREDKHRVSVLRFRHGSRKRLKFSG